MKRSWTTRAEKLANKGLIVPPTEEKAMRELTGHKVNPANDTLDVLVMDQPGSGGANHHYQVRGFNTGTNPSDPFTQRYGKPGDHTTLLFQNGPIAEVGVNGITHEALLAVLIDRLECFQAGKFANEYNAAALDHLRSAQGVLLDRTRARMARGVEGTHTV